MRLQVLTPTIVPEAPRFLSTQITLAKFERWYEANLDLLQSYFRQLQDEGAAPPDFFEFCAVQHEVELIRITVQPC